MVGTDAYPILRDAWPALVDCLSSKDAEVVLAAAYCLAFVLEPSASTLPALALARRKAKDPMVKAGLELAYVRLDASVALLRGEGYKEDLDVVPLPPNARKADPTMRAVFALGVVFRIHPTRRVEVEVAEALDAIPAPCCVGSWGNGQFRTLRSP